MPAREAGLPTSSGGGIRGATGGATLRTPQLGVLVNGVALAGAVSAEVTSNSHYAADRFRVRTALRADDPSLWAQADMLVEVRMGLGGAWASLVTGAVDRLDIDPVQEVVELEGRDLTAGLIEARTQETFANRTSSEIATILAGRQGLGTDVAATGTPVGRYYQSEHDRITLDQFSRATTQWDLLVFLARHEGFDVWVDGTTLHFQPQVTGSAGAVALTPGDCMDLRLERSLTLARDIEVTVKSWNTRQQAAFTQTARSGPQGSAGSGTASGKVQRYVYVRPNLTPQDALQLASRILADLSRHERVVRATLPGELALTPRSLVQLSGTGTDFDQVYYVAEIERRLSVAGGFVQTVRAKNSSPASAASTPVADDGTG